MVASNLARQGKTPRQAAKLRGDVTYTPAVACAYCGSYQRYTKGAQCLECTKRRSKAARSVGRYKAIEVAYNKRYHKTNKLRNRLKIYGLTPEAFAALLLQQNNACAICATPLRDGRETHIDHCHTTKRVRAILCRSCNVGIGHFAHDAERLRTAAAYCDAWAPAI